MSTSPITPSQLSRIREHLDKEKRNAPVTLRAEEVNEMLCFINYVKTPVELQLFLRVKEFCTEFDNGRGIWKRIDENRELLMSLQSREPKVLERCPWIERFLCTQDAFLAGILSALAIDQPVWMPSGFPREWPGASDPLEYYKELTPASVRNKQAPLREVSAGNDIAP